MKNTKIEWCHHTVNLWTGCTHVHAGCDNCYAEALSNRFGQQVWGNDSKRLRTKNPFAILQTLQRAAKKANEVHRVFIGSMMDIFEKPMPLLNPVEAHFEITDDIRQELFTQITWDDGSLYPNLMFLFLTKRPSNIKKYVPAGWLDEPPKNVMYGVSVSDQESYDTLVNQLVTVPGKHFLSIEPLLGPIKMRLYEHIPTKKGVAMPMNYHIDWIIVGGESGHNARPMHPDWVRSIRDQCEDYHIPFLFKQWGEYRPFIPTAQAPFWRDCATGEEYDGNIMNFVDYDHESEAGKFLGYRWYPPMDTLSILAQNYDQDCAFLKMGKLKSGNLLDCKQYLNFPYEPK